MMNKGSVLDIVFLTVMFTLIAVGILVIYQTTLLMSTAVQAAGINSTAEVAMMDASLTAVQDWNYIFSFVYVAVNLATAISAFMVRSHPVMFLVFFIVQVVAVVISGQMATVWNTIYSDPVFTGAVLFTDMNAIFANYGVLTLIFSLVVALAMMAIPL